MKHTFKSWLIANIENIMMVIALPVLLLFFLKIENVDIVGILGFILLCSLVPTKKVGDGFTFFVFALALCGYTFYILGGLGWIIAASIIGLIGAVMTATFVYNHTEEVLSRRYFYRSSNVDYLEFKMKYTIERFFTSFRCLFVLCFLVWFVFNQQSVIALLK